LEACVLFPLVGLTHAKTRYQSSGNNYRIQLHGRKQPLC
jgi:hypothetical protein